MGRRRLEPLGILVFSVIMIISFIQILQESVEKEASKGPHEPATLPPVASDGRDDWAKGDYLVWLH